MCFLLGAKVTSIQHSSQGFRVTYRTTTDQSISYPPSLFRRVGACGTLQAQNVVLAVGKEGAVDAQPLASQLGISSVPNRACLGVRLEVRRSVVEHLVRSTRDPKISMFVPSGIRVKTHCFGHPGEVLVTRYHGLPLAGGQGVPGGRSCTSTFAVLVQDTGSSPWTYDLLAGMANRVKELGDSLASQTMGEFLRAHTDRSIPKGRFSPTLRPPAVRADIRGWLDELSLGEVVEEFLWRLSQLAPGLLAPDHLVYFPAIEWWMPRLDTNDDMMTRIPGLYAVGDGAGLSQGIVQAAATGVVAARAIVRRIEAADRRPAVDEAAATRMEGATSGR